MIAGDDEEDGEELIARSDSTVCLRFPKPRVGSNIHISQRAAIIRALAYRAEVSDSIGFGCLCTCQTTSERVAQLTYTFNGDNDGGGNGGGGDAIDENKPQHSCPADRLTEMIEVLLHGNEPLIEEDN